MTERTFDLTQARGFSSGKIRVAEYGSGKVGIDLTEEATQRRALANLNPEQAREVAEFILSLLPDEPEPEPVDPYAEARAAWESLEIGDEFNFVTGTRPGRRHVKESETEYRHDWGNGRMSATTSKIENYLRYGIFPHPKPTLLEQQWPEVPIGAIYGFSKPHGLLTEKGDYGFPYTKTSEALHNGSPLTANDKARGIHWYVKPPQPTVAEQVAALEVGTHFKTPFGYRFLKVGPDEFYSYSDKKMVTPSNWKNTREPIEVEA